MALGAQRSGIVRLVLFTAAKLSFMLSSKGIETKMDTNGFNAKQVNEIKRLAAIMYKNSEEMKS